MCILRPDIAGTSVEQSEARYKEMLDRASHERHPQKVFKAEFITADCTKVADNVPVVFIFDRQQC